MEEKLNADDNFQNDRQNNSDSKTINLSFSLTRTDLFWYNIYFVRLLAVGAIMFFVLAIGTFVLTLYTLPGDLRSTLIWIIMAFGVGFSLCAGSVAAISLQIFVLKNESVTRAMTFRNYIISASGIAVFNEQGRIIRTWQDIKRVIKTQHGFYVKTGDRIAIVLPRNVFSDKDEIRLFEKLAERAKT